MPRTLRRAAPLACLAAAGGLALASCTSGSPAPTPPAGSSTVAPTSASRPASAPAGTGAPKPSTPAPTPPHPSTPRPTPHSPTARPTPHPTPADALAGLTLAQKVGQLFLVGGAATGPTAPTYAAIRDHHVGGVILTGRSTLGVASTRHVADELQSARAAGDPHPLFVATDQEGGNIQVLRGPGFSTMPTALTQGKLAPSTLRADATTWGAQLHAAGVNLDLAPVMDVVPSPSDNASNAPVGYWHRQYGYTPATVVSHADAFGDGLRASGVGDTIKHFPGLGRVTGNTDFTAGVTDDVTTAHDAYVRAFAAGIANRPTAVMTSTAIYAKIDPKNPGAFSSTVVTGLLRGDLGWQGLVITDDLSQAKQVASWTPGERAVKAIAAGNDVVLAGTASQIPEMTAAVIAEARSDPSFAKRVDASAARVLAAKASVLG